MSMELGGNAPFVVFEDADLDRAVDGAVIAKMRNIGESCVAANRFLVAEAVAEEFAAGLAAKMGSLRMGRGTEPEADVGPLIDEDQRSKVTELVEDAVGRGGKVLAGGGRREGAGYFFEPTVIGAVPDDSKILSEEVFGPVAPVTAFGTEDEGVARANGTEYGLVAYVFTRDLERALRVVEGLEVGMIGLNRGLVSNPAAPFGGVKQSGFGLGAGRASRSTSRRSTSPSTRGNEVAGRYRHSLACRHSHTAGVGAGGCHGSASLGRSLQAVPPGP